MNRTVDAYVSTARRFFRMGGLAAGLLVYLVMALFFVRAITNPLFGMVLGFALAISAAIAIPLLVQFVVARLMIVYDARAPWV